MTISTASEFSSNSLLSFSFFRPSSCCCCRYNLNCSNLFFIEFIHLGEDTTMRFSLTPCSGEKGFQQWKDAISVAIRMPGGLPPPIRQKVKFQSHLSLSSSSIGYL